VSDNFNGKNNPSEKSRRSTTFLIEFPTMPTLKRQPRIVEMHQAHGQHDILIIQFTSTGEVWFDDIPTGLPLKFSWQQGIVSTEWYGYVSYVSKTVANSQREKIMEVHCVGSTFPLKERDNRVFTDTTIPEAVASIVKENGMNFIGDPHPRRFPQLTMAGHSYWEWIQEQAKRIGFATIVDGSNFYFRRIDGLIDQTISSVPVLDAGDSPSLYRAQYYDRTLDMFRVLKGDHIESSPNLRTEKVTAGVDPFTGEAHTTSATPANVGVNLRTSSNEVLFSEYRSDQVVSQYSEGELMAQGAAQMARMTMPAKVKCQGDGRIRPYNPVYIRGTGALTDGYWVVKEAKHIFQKFGDYNVEMTIVTDGLGENQVSGYRNKDFKNMSMVNIAERLSRPDSLESTSRRTGTSLQRTAPIISVKNQGYVKTPALWQSAGR
jgi:phage protein D